jgi:hypothetical protein
MRTYVRKWRRESNGRKSAPTTKFGHTRDECKRRFGFSNGAWTRAVDRGDVVPRPRTDSLRTHEKRERVTQLRARGKTYVEIANELGLTKSTVAYHARRLGIPADERFARRYDWRLVQTAVDAGASMRQCMKRFGFSRDAWGKAVKPGDIVPNDWVTPLESLLVAGRQRSRGHIKARLLRAGLKENRCERCGLGEWQGSHSTCSFITSTGMAWTIGSRTSSSCARIVTRRRRLTAGGTGTGAGVRPATRRLPEIHHRAFPVTAASALLP